MRPSFLLHLFLLLILIPLTACNTFSRRQCESMDWRQAGFASAHEGKTLSDTMGYYEKECFQIHSVKPVSEQLQVGYNTGLDSVCTPEGGQRAGLSGIRYAGICPQAKEKLFLPEYQKGRMQFLETKYTELMAENNSLKSELASKESTISSLESQVGSLQSQVSSVQSRCN